MLVFEKKTDLEKHLTEQRKRGHTVGFVPTMGALHKGHISLIERSKAENDVTVCSIFVNPTQFNDKSDLEKYPRPIEADKALLEKTGCDVLFVPGEREIYPEGGETRDEGRGTKEGMGNTDMGIVGTTVQHLPADTQSQLRQTSLKSDNRYLQVQLGDLEKVMEGTRRPGHFEGVVQVVSKLFDIVSPDRAYFGQKDFQQQTIIKEMVRQLNYGIQIITCPIVREPDGLAMSSRNARLTPSERAVAGIISQTLFTIQKLAGKLSVDELTMLVESEIAEGSLTELEYFEIVDAGTLQPVLNLDKAESAVACIAVKVGQVRLIDNVILK
ncbi:MAG: pantoate--beta-alanine ligase [Bacteroidia bacterium]|nr:pantoate--beta-alanine ligase [Bacteroidia bacterium]